MLYMMIRNMLYKSCLKNMTQEERDGKFPEGVTKIARVHNSVSVWLRLSIYKY